MRDSLPLIVGRLYVENYFNNQTKLEVSKFATSIRDQFTQIIEQQDWMDLTTKKKALNKAKLMKDKYGFPQYILNDTRINEEYNGLALSSGGDFWQYTWDINLWAIQKHLSKLRKPVDKELWSMSVEETNAYYSPTDNAMVFPAGTIVTFLGHGKVQNALGSYKKNIFLLQNTKISLKTACI